MDPFVAVLSTLGVFVICVTVLPTLAQLVVSPRPWLRAVEALNAVALNDRARWVRAAGSVPRLFSRGHARRWIRNHPGVGGLGRIRLLVWTGDLNAAAQVAAGLPQATAKGRGDLSEARSVLAQMESGPERDEARLDLAVEEARLAHAAGDDWLVPLAAARAEVTALPRGATIRERFLAGLPSTIAIILIVGTISFVVNR
jgi:hypothetical protein